MTLAKAGKRLWTWLKDHRLQWGLSLRVTVSAVATLLASHLLNLRIPLWAVLTAVILTQLSVGRSLRATTDYFIGTVGAAVYAGAVGALFPVTSELSLAAGLALAVAPATLLAALNPRLSAAPFTAVLVFLAPTITHATPVASALERLLEVAVGGTIGLIVSLLVLPARAHDLAIEAAAHMLELMARLQPGLFGKFTQQRGADDAGLLLQLDEIGQALIKLETTASEARHEHMTRLSADPDQGPLVRTMLRLRHDLVMIWRAAREPLPAPFEARLGSWLKRIGSATGDFLNESAGSLRARRGPPSLDAVIAALDGYAADMGTLRLEGKTRELPVHAAERVFALGFALDQVRQHLTDLARCVGEFAAPGRRSGPPRVVSGDAPNQMHRR